MKLPPVLQVECPTGCGVTMLGMKAEIQIRPEDVQAAVRAHVHGEPIHLCPDGDAAVMTCCGRSPFEVPRSHRMTLDSAQVTCGSRTEEDA